MEPDRLGRFRDAAEKHRREEDELDRSDGERGAQVVAGRTFVPGPGALRVEEVNAEGQPQKGEEINRRNQSSSPSFDHDHPYLYPKTAQKAISSGICPVPP